jgi:hypothetical protein
MVWHLKSLRISFLLLAFLFNSQYSLNCPLRSQAILMLAWSACSSELLGQESGISSLLSCCLSDLGGGKLK